MKTDKYLLAALLASALDVEDFPELQPAVKKKRSQPKEYNKSKENARRRKHHKSK